MMLPAFPLLQVRDTVAVHVPCSSKKMGIEDSTMKLAQLCANEVVSSGIPCCGMAGDRGMRYPELVDASLQHLKLPEGVTDGYSTSRTCEVGCVHVQRVVPWSSMAYSWADFRSVDR